jgi:hypothetical protein
VNDVRLEAHRDKAAVTIDEGVPLVLVTSASNVVLSDVGMVVSRFSICSGPQVRSGEIDEIVSAAVEYGFQHG